MNQRVAAERHGGRDTRTPGQRFGRTSGIDTHYDPLRFAWELTTPDGALTVAGIDDGVLGADGKRQLSGFFGDLPQEQTP